MAESASTPVVMILDDRSTDEEGRAEAIDDLRAEMLPLAPAEPLSAGEAPPGTRGAELVEAGALLVTLAGSGSLAPVIDLVLDWVRRRGSGSVRMRIGEDEIELTGASRAAQQQALDAFLDRHRS